MSQGRSEPTDQGRTMFTKMTLRNSLLAAVCSLALIGQASAETPRNVNVQAGDLAQALDVLAKQCGVDVVYPSKQLKGMTTKGVSGTLETREAFERLIEGTRLVLREEGKSVMISLPKGEATTKAPGEHGIRVAQAEGTVAAGAEERQGESEGARAEEAGVQLDEIVVTGTHIRGAAPAGSPLHVYDSADFERSGYSTTEQFIESLPQNVSTVSSDALSSASDGSANIAYGTTVNLRGLGSDATLILLNGRRLPRSGDGGQLVDVSMLPFTALERVEVLTDGASAIYGSDAIGGVVNFVLRRDYQGAETRVRYGTVTSGSLNERRVAQTVGHTFGATNVLGSYEFYDRDALSLSDRNLPASPDLAGSSYLLPEQKRHSVLLALQSSPSDVLHLSAEGTYTDSEGLSVADVFGLHAVSRTAVDQATVSGGLEYSFFREWRARVNGSYGRVETRRARSVDAVPQLDTRPVFELLSAGTVADGNLFSLGGGSAKIALGASLIHESFDQSDIVATGSAGVSLKRDIYAAFSELSLPFIGAANARRGLAALNAVIAARYEHYSDFGSSFSPKAGLLWAPVNGLRMRATYGRSFKAPSFNELGNAFGVSLFQVPDSSAPTGETLSLFHGGGNPNLNPERARSWTAGIDVDPQQVPWLKLSATYFNIEYEKRIDFVPDPFAALDLPEVYGSFVIRSPSEAQITALIAMDDNGIVDDFTPEQLGNINEAQALIFFGYTNLSASRVNGVDFAVDANFSSQRLHYGGSVSASYLLSSENQTVSATPFQSILNKPLLPIDLRVRGQLFVESQAVQASLSANFTDSYRNDRDVVPVPVDSWLVFDANVSFSLDAMSRASALSGAKLTIAANNIFNTRPPRLFDPFDVTFPGYDAVNASPLGRLLAIELRKSW